MEVVKEIPCVTQGSLKQRRTHKRSITIQRSLFQDLFKTLSYIPEQQTPRLVCHGRVFYPTNIG